MTERRTGIARPSVRSLEREAEIERYGRRNPGKPEPAFLAVRKVKKGVEIGARIAYEPSRDPDTGEFLDRSYYWTLYEDERIVEQCPQPGDRLLGAWEGGRRIEENEYNHLVAVRAWDREYDPASPGANPRKPVNLRELPPILPPGVAR